MTRLLFRILLMALAFYFIFPMIGGIQFHGNFMHALGAGLFFALMSWVLELIAVAASAVLTIGTLGVALLVLVPLWLIGYWLFPAFVLMVVADFMPAYLTVEGWGPAILGGLLMLVIGIVTDSTMERCRDRPCAPA